MIDSQTLLTPVQVEQFHRDGFVALDRLVPHDELPWMRAVYDRLFEARAGREEGNQFDLGGTDEEGATPVLPQILNLAKYAPELKNGLYRANALAVAQELLGPECKYGGEHAIFKPAGHGAATPWHQDEAYWDPDKDYTSISIWIPLQEATVENGCMWFVPGSHLGAVKPHHCINNDPRIHGLEIDDAEWLTAGKAVACPLPAGGCTVHLNRTMHYAGPNTSGVARRAYILGYGLPQRPRSEPRRFPWNEDKHPAREERARQAQQAAQQ